MRGCPDLAMGVRVGTPHKGALVFKDLDRPIGRAKFGTLSAPAIDDSAYCCRRQLGHRQRMIGRVADHPRHPACLLGSKERVVGACLGRIRHHGSKIVVEHKARCISGIAMPPRPFVARAQIAARIIGWSGPPVGPILLSLPWPRQPMRRDQHPAPGQRVAPSVRKIGRQRHAAARFHPTNCACRPSTKRLTASANSTELTSVMTMKSI